MSNQARNNALPLDGAALYREHGITPYGRSSTLTSLVSLDVAEAIAAHLNAQHKGTYWTYGPVPGSHSRYVVKGKL